MKASLLATLLCLAFSSANANMTEIRCQGVIKNATSEVTIDKTINISDLIATASPQKIAALGKTEIALNYKDSAALGPYDLVSLIATIKDAGKPTTISSTTIAFESNLIFLSKTSEQAESFNAYCEVK